jgi:CelD/BcsL family acetyltransferase involved in cellulose biosynthesis
MAQATPILIHARAEHREAPAHPQFRRDAHSAGQSPFQISVTDDLSAVEREWRTFEQYADCTAFQSFDWLQTWQRCIGVRAGVVPAIVVGRRAGGELAFIFPLAIEQSRFAVRLTFLGRELGDYNAPLLAPGFSSTVTSDTFPALWQEVRDLLQRDKRFRHDVILLDKLPERVGSQHNPFLALNVAANPSGAYLTSLAGDWETFYTAKRSSSTRRRDRSKRKKLGENGEVRMVTPVVPEDSVGTLDVLIEQKSRAFGRMGVPDIFARPGYPEFYTDLVSRSPALVHVSRLQIGSTYAATNFGLVFRGRYYHVLASYDEGPLSRFGPGAAHLHELMRYAIERGCDCFDFTIGDEPYKRDWCDTELKLYDHVAAVTPRGWLVAAPVALARRAKRAIKQSPFLWGLVTRLRAARGATKPAGTAGAMDSDPEADSDRKPA